MEALSSPQATPNPYVYWLRWIMLFLVVAFLFYFFKTEKQRSVDAKTRLWRRFLHIHSELFEHLTDTEKSEMFSVYKTTVLNAELFKNVDLEAKNASPLSSSKRKTKKVTFNLA